MGFVLMHHPELEADYAAPVEAIGLYTEKGWEVVDAGDVRDTPTAFEEDIATAPGAVTADPQPAKNASTNEWQSYALTHGMPPEQAGSMTRDELVAHYTEETHP